MKSVANKPSPYPEEMRQYHVHNSAILIKVHVDVSNVLNQHTVDCAESATISSEVRRDSNTIIIIAETGHDWKCQKKGYEKLLETFSNN